MKWRRHAGNNSVGINDLIPIVASERRIISQMHNGKQEQQLARLLKGVSRSFYLTLRVLPKNIREPVGLAYLLARAADTISDTRFLPTDERLTHLRAFQEQLLGEAPKTLDTYVAAELTDTQSSLAERKLLHSLPRVLSMLEDLNPADLRLVRSVVLALTYGMEMDLTGFPSEDSGQVVALRDQAALDSYTYQIAGCVGEFWTEITVAYTQRLAHWDADAMAKDGVRFGKALQMTNVLRDVPRDLRIGRCYLPESDLVGVGLTPDDLLDPAVAVKARPALVNNMGIALGHYQAAQRYLLAIPRRCVRLRLAVTWPLVIGLATLAKLARNDGWLELQKPTKVSRLWVYRAIAMSVLFVLSNTLLTAWTSGLRNRVEKGL